MIKKSENPSDSGDLIRVDEDAYVPERFIDEDGDLLIYDGQGHWIARDKNGEIVKKVSF